MPVPSGLASLSQTALSNSPAGSDTVFPSLDDYLREIFADLARLRDGAHSTLTSVSGTDTITASCAQISTFAAGQVFAFVSAGANTTTTVTLNINGSGAKNVLRAGGAAMAVGDIPASGLVFVGYNGTNFEHLNTKHAVTADSATNATTVTNGVYTAGDQTIAGIKTFSSSPVVPTLSAGDNSTKAASTAYVDAAAATAASSGTTQTGTNTTQFVTPKGLADTMLGGAGQTLQNLTGSRALSTTYTNSTGRPILVAVNTTAGAGASYFGITVAGLLVQQCYAPVGFQASVQALVGVGETYSVAGGVTISTWLERR